MPLRSRRTVSTLIATVAALAFATVTSGPASAEPRSSGATAADQRAARCAETAGRQGAKAWICLGETVISEGVTVDPEKLPPAITNGGTSSGGPAASRSSAAAAADDYDYWCEATGVCTRRISNYISETKANIYYGYNNQNVGNFDAILRTNLNGRQAQSKLSLIWDSGPRLYFEYAKLNCFEEIAFAPDTNCGNFQVGSGVYIGPGGAYRWNSGTSYGNRLNNSNEYYTTVSARFRPTGYSTLTFGYLFESARFNCYGNDNCYFP